MGSTSHIAICIQARASSCITCETCRTEIDGRVDWRYRTRELPKQLHRFAFRAFSQGGSAYSPLAVMETHAVCLGFKRLAPDNDGDSLLWLANRFYENTPQYLRALNTMADEWGKEAAFIVLPRMCFLSLQARRSYDYDVESFEAIESRDKSAATVLRVEPLDVSASGQALIRHLSLRSLRERGNTVVGADGHSFDLTNHYWVSTI